MERILVVSEGTLQLVPFGVLPDPGGRGDAPMPLIVKHEIANLPSASTLAVLRRELARRPSPPHVLAVLADPVFDRYDERVQKLELPPITQDEVDLGRKFRRLLFSRQEAEEISEHLPASEKMLALDFRASKKTAISGVLARYQIVHLSTHAVLDQTHPELSALVFSLLDEHGQSQDGFLRLHEIYNLRLPVDMVVLSACQSLVGSEIRGEGLVGLSRGFMYAGAKSIVASLWSVDDRSTKELMKRFYQGILGAKPLGPAAALRAAQVAMWRDGHWKPYHWAGFVLQGEW